MVNILKGVAVIVATIILGFIVTGALLMSYEALTGNFPVGTEGLILIWVISSIIFSGPVRRLINRG
ncbi:hypothetical protein E4H04_13505, partial [Candidatus Bathyarchaeota archaeon]